MGDDQVTVNVFVTECLAERSEKAGALERGRTSEMRDFLLVRKLKEGCRLNRDVRTKQPSAWEVVLLA